MPKPRASGLQDTPLTALDTDPAWKEYGRGRPLVQVSLPAWPGGSGRPGPEGALAAVPLSCGIIPVSHQQ